MASSILASLFSRAESPGAGDAGAGHFGLSTGRLEALSDGVFAIVVTLLILLIEPPPAHLNEGMLLKALAEMWVHVVAYVISFVLLGIYWWRHHVIFHYLKKTDRTLLWLNILFLMVVAFVPFPTALLIEYLGTAEEEIAVLLYGGVHVLCGGMLYAMWSYATKGHRLVRSDLSPLIVAQLRVHLLLKVGVYVLSMAVSFVNVYAALLLYALIPALNFLTRTRGLHEVDLVQYAK
jgi:uncharacterized membrane protein